MLQSKGWTRVTQVLSLLVLIVSIALNSGCASQGVTLHPILASDIQPMDKGKPYSPEKDGWFLSSEYLKEVLKATVK